MFSPGKRNDIIRELTLLENPNAEISGDTTLNPVGSKLDTSESVGKEYGVSKGSVVRLIRINKLIDELKALWTAESCQSVQEWSFHPVGRYTGSCCRVCRGLQN